MNDTIIYGGMNFAARRDFWRAVADGIAVAPAIMAEFGEEWSRWEGTTAAFNPLATTQKMPGSSRFNDAGVQEYDTAQQGVQATVWTLDPRSYGGTDYYPTIRAALRLRSVRLAGRSNVATELRTWGTIGFADVIANGWEFSDDAPPNGPTEPGDIGDDDPDDEIARLYRLIARQEKFIMRHDAFIHAMKGVFR